MGIGELGFCQLISQKEQESIKRKDKDYLTEFKNLKERLLKIIEKLKIPQDVEIPKKPIDFELEKLDVIYSEYSERVDIIEKEILDIEEIKLTMERDLKEIIEKENQYKKISRNNIMDSKISLLLEEKLKFEQDLEYLAKKYYNEILLYNANLAFLIPYLEATQKITHTKLFSIINCWVISKRYSSLEQKIEKITSKKYIILREKPNKKKELPPTIMKHSKFLNPFENLVRLYGVPNYYEIDPTIIIAITFPLLFGLMFGDIGQGLVLMLGSAMIALKTKRTIAKILFYCGIGAIFAGFLYGEFFGFYISEIWPAFRPLLPFPNTGLYLDLFSTGIGYNQGVIDNIAFMLLISIFIGYIQISTGFLIQFVNNYKKGKKYDAWLVSMPSFLILTNIIFIAFSFGFDFDKYFSPSPFLLNLPPIFLIIIPFIILILGKPFVSIFKKEGKAKALIGQGLLHTWEVGLGIITNIPSYARVFALIMIHWGLNEAIHAIGNTFNNIFIYSIIFGLGTAFIILLEVVIVSAHALRLHFYEWFGKFYEDNGIEFKPFKLPIDSKIYELESYDILG